MQEEMLLIQKSKNLIENQLSYGILIKLKIKMKKLKYSFKQYIQTIAQSKFRDIAEAYAVLSDKKKKDMFDQGVDPNDQNAGYDNVDPSQVFSMFFGGGGGFQNFGGGSNVRFEFR